MATPSTHQGDHYYTGNVRFRDVDLSEQCVNDDHVASDADIAATKLVHQFPLNYTQAPGSDIATATLDLHIAYGDGDIVSVEAAVTGVAATGDRSVTVDLHKSTGGAAFATVLSAPITLDIGNALRVLEAGSLSTTTYLDGDLLRMIVTQVAGSAGTRPQGLIVTVFVRENARRPPLSSLRIRITTSSRSVRRRRPRAATPGTGINSTRKATRSIRSMRFGYATRTVRSSRRTFTTGHG
jgi:hypothetical protein